MNSSSDEYYRGVFFDWAILFITCSSFFIIFCGSRRPREDLARASAFTIEGYPNSSADYFSEVLVNRPIAAFLLRLTEETLELCRSVSVLSLRRRQVSL